MDKFKLSLIVGTAKIVGDKTFAGTRDEVNYIDGDKDTLDYITPFVAIDFVNWLNANDYVKAYKGIDTQMCKENNWKIEYSTNELFQLFLKDYIVK